MIFLKVHLRIGKKLKFDLAELIPPEYGPQFSGSIPEGMLSQQLYFL